MIEATWTVIIIWISVISIAIVFGCIAIALLESFTGVFTMLFKRGRAGA